MNTVNRRFGFVPRPDVTFVNRLNGEQITGEWVGEDDIGGQSFYIVRSGIPLRTMKLSKDAFMEKKMSKRR